MKVLRITKRKRYEAKSSLASNYEMKNGGIRGQARGLHQAGAEQDTSLD